MESWSVEVAGYCRISTVREPPGRKSVYAWVYYEKIITRVGGVTKDEKIV